MKASTTIFLIMAIMIVALIGFFPTYFSKFPEFDGLKDIHHFHGAMMVSWFGMLIAQPMLVHYKKLDWHKTLGRISYVVAPLVAISIYLVMREEYYDDLSKYTRERSLAGLDLDLMSLLSFIILYALAIGYKRKMDHHMRYMICTGLLIFIPGMARLFVFLIGFSNSATGLLILLITYGLYAFLIIYDFKNRHTIKPYLVGLVLVTLTNFVVMSNKSGWWQWIAGTFAEYAM